MRPPTNGDLVVVRLTNPIVEGHIGTIKSIHPKRQRWPQLYVIILDAVTGDPDEVHQLNLTIDEFYVVA